jgi:hypothetical protein
MGAATSDQLKRILARRELAAFVEKHGLEKCEAMQARIKIHVPRSRAGRAWWAAQNLFIKIRDKLTGSSGAQ